MVFLLGLVLVFKIKVIISIRTSSKILDFCRLKGPITDKRPSGERNEGPSRGTPLRAKSREPTVSHFRARSPDLLPVGGPSPGPRWPLARQGYCREDRGGEAA